MKKYLIGLLFLFLFQLQAQNHFDELFKKGISLYSQKKYEKALTTFKELEKEGKVNGEVYYNIGNCYYRLNKPALALYYYELAKLYLGNDPDLIHNIEVIHKRLPGLIKVPPKLFIIRWWNSFFDSVNVTFLIIILTILLLIFNIFFLLKLVYRHSRLIILLNKITWGIALFIFLILLSIYFEWKHDYTHQFGIIMEQKVAVKNEPFDESSTLYYIRQGQKVELLRKIKGWQEILLPDGNKGWIKKNEVWQLKEKVS